MDAKAKSVTNLQSGGFAGAQCPMPVNAQKPGRELRHQAAYEGIHLARTASQDECPYVGPH